MMKTAFKFLKYPLVAAFLIATVSCSNDDDNNGTADATIAVLAQGSADLTILVDALERADLVDVLNQSGNYTVFAPNNAAFSAFLSANGFASVDEVPVNVLTNILLNHVINEEFTATEFITAGAGYESTLAENADGDNLSIYYRANAGTVTLNGISDVVSGGANIEATNGIIHIVDAVIGLPTVVTFATADPTFEILVSALTREDEFTFVETLSTPAGTVPAPFTVFAPTNDAFVSLLAELSLTSLNDVPTETLAATLTYHVVAQANVRSTDLTDDFTVTTLGGNITADVTGGARLTDANERVSNIVAVNVQAMNGVIHVIDKVILPPL